MKLAPIEVAARLELFPPMRKPAERITRGNLKPADTHRGRGNFIINERIFSHCMPVSLAIFPGTHQVKHYCTKKCKKKMNKINLVRVSWPFVLDSRPLVPGLRMLLSTLCQPTKSRAPATNSNWITRPHRPFVWQEEVNAVMLPK